MNMTNRLLENHVKSDSIEFDCGKLNYDKYSAVTLNIVLMHFCDLASQGQFLLNPILVSLSAKGLR